jgi:hypothetical protein
MVRVIKLRRIRWAGHGGREETYIGFLLRKSEGKNRLEDPGVDGRILL